MSLMILICITGTGEWKDVGDNLKLSMLLIGIPNYLNILEVFFSNLSADVRTNYELVRKKMNSRFEPWEPPNTVCKQLQALHQEVDESMEEWAEHCQHYAYDAWGDINAEVAELAAVETFCTGAVDSEAVLPVLEKDPSTLDDALEMLKRSVHNWQSVNMRSRSSQKAVRSVSFAADSLLAVDICTAGVINSSTDSSVMIQKVESENYYG